ncbi:MAG: DUF3078 domain-containing protein [Flavobacteriaceae bacterium]|nr:DUF3078 domain-containing protein [Flavobacteriaceae bacterium]
MKTFIIFIAILFFSFASAQITDSIAVIKQSGFVKKVVNDTLKVKISIDSIKIVKLNDTLNVLMHLDSLGIFKATDTVKRLTKIDSLKIRLDSLLRPFYAIRYDSTLNKDIYIPRYRMTVNTPTKDTIYTPIPKVTDFISFKKELVIDTLKILNPIQIITIDTTKFAEYPIWWQNKNSIGLDISEAAFINWNAGGNNSISGLLNVSIIKTYKKLHLLWNNEIFARYGLNQQQEKGLRKTDDRLQVNSTFGYRKDTISNWFYSIKFNFNTQFTEGFRYPDTSTPISRFFAPAYLFLGIGSQYEIKQRRFSIYLSPITLKSTFVLDDVLSNEGAFGVIKGKKSRHEFGALVQSTWDTEIAKNMVMSNRLSLYSDYLNSFGNVDIDWELNLKLTINKHIKANIGTHILYDNDIKFKDDIDNDGTLETFGARVQLKQLLGIGVLFSF